MILSHFPTQTPIPSTQNKSVLHSIVRLLQAVRLNHTFEQIGVIARLGKPGGGRIPALLNDIVMSIDQLLALHITDTILIFYYSPLKTYPTTSNSLSVDFFIQKIETLVNIASICLSIDSLPSPKYTLESPIK